MRTRSIDVVRPLSSLKVTQPEAVKALEQVWQRRRRELADWQPSGGWLIDLRENAVREPVHGLSNS